VVELGHNDAGDPRLRQVCSCTRMRQGERGSEGRKDKDEEIKEKK
jgi:hypothetical protein